MTKNSVADMKLFPTIKYDMESKEECKDVISELLKSLAFISNSEGPLKMELPVPEPMTKDKNLPQLKKITQQNY